MHGKIIINFIYVFSFIGVISATSPTTSLAIMLYINKDNDQNTQNTNFVEWNPIIL